MNKKPLRYQAFVLRMWAEPEPTREVWRFSLEDTQTGERSGFADLEHLAHFLIRRMKVAGPSPPLDP
jgi:hypothetical protein